MPSLVRRSGGFDVPDFLAAGPRDLLVPAGGEDAARDVLGTRAAPPARAPRAPAPAGADLGARARARADAGSSSLFVAAGVISAIVG